ncbi:MAG: hypothetical protein MR900_05505 [Prevotella sp.]|nr:hypothetical protein [Prevotella sp.]MDY5685728.1 hypothetical protein [Prevotella sp.]
MNDVEFEKYWKENRMSILMQDSEYRKATGSGKLSSGADLILFAIPIAAGIVFMEHCHFDNELLKWGISAIITIAAFVLCVFIKTIITVSAPPEEIESRIKKATKEKLHVTQ